MNAQALVLPVKVVLAPAFLAAVVLSCFFSFAAPVHAQELTPDRLQVVSSLLSSYGVDEAHIQSALAALAEAPAPAPQESSDLGAAVIQFAGDYADAFNANLAAVLAAPLGVAVNSLSNVFVAVGIGQDNSAAVVVPGGYYYGTQDGEHSFASTTMATTTCGAFIRSIWGGDRGDDVSQLQQFLANHFGIVTSDIVTGNFGSTTEGWVKRFQQEQGLPPVGNVGPQTRAAIKNNCGNAYGRMNNQDQRDNHESTTTPRGDDKHPVPPPRPAPWPARMGSSTPTASSTSRENNWKGAGNVSAPTCTLAADNSTIQPGAQVTLTWTSTNATEASTPRGGRGPAQGSATFMPTNTTVYHKTVFGPGGKGGCEVTVTVSGSTSTSTMQARAQPDSMAAAAQFAGDYSEAFNQNMAAVATVAVGVPFSIITDVVSDALYRAGLY